MYLPLYYDKINLLNGMYNPSPVKNRNNASFDYWVRTLFHRASSTMIFGLPEYWQGYILDSWYYYLLKFGFLSVQDLTKQPSLKAKKIGMCFSPVGFEGYNFYHFPTHALLSNPTLDDTIRLEIGKECAIVNLTPDFMGIWDVIERYAEMLSNLDNAINMSIINNKFAFVLAGKTKAAIQTLKKMMDLINKGEPAVFLDERVVDMKDGETPFQSWTRDNLKQSYLTTDQLLDLHTILSDFDSEVGIPTVPYQKKERETEYESKSKVADGMARSLVWKRCLESSLKNVNALYPELNITFKLRWEVEDNVDNENNDARTSERTNMEKSKSV